MVIRGARAHSACLWSHGAGADHTRVASPSVRASVAGVEGGSRCCREDTVEVFLWRRNECGKGSRRGG